MSNQINKRLLGDFCSFKYGKTIRKCEVAEKGGHPVFSGYQVVGYLDSYMYHDPQLLVVCRGIGGTGDIKFSPPKCSITNLSIVISIKDKTFLGYLFWVLKNADTHSLRTGSAQPQITINDLERFPVLIHESNHEQKAIAHILGTLDDKIELNRKTNETLEAMAKALFKSWFVDFDPVRAKAEGRPTGLSAEISDLFPDSFEDSELGEIPSGWAIGTIENIAEVIDCLHSKKPDQQEVGKQLLQLNNIEDNGLLNQSQMYFISSDDYAKWSSRIEVEQGDCVITNVGRVGAVAQIPKGVKAAMGRNMTAIRTKGIFPYPTFLLEYLLSAFGREEIRLNIDEGTILNALNVKNIPLLRFFRSPDSILNAYEKSARPLREAMESSLKENQSLSALRDALLPKLISGELRIPDAEKMLEEVDI